MGFEPTRGDPIGLAVQRLNHSATSSTINFKLGRCDQVQSVANHDQPRIRKLLSSAYLWRRMPPSIGLGLEMARHL